MKIDLIATAAFGLESVVAGELRSLGYDQLAVDNGKVEFSGDPMSICRVNLWLRCAGRVLLKMGRFSATSFEELFEKTRALPWAEWLPRDGAFPVEGNSVDSTLHSVPDCQAIVKKAIVESMKRRFRVNWFEETGPSYPIRVNLLKDVVTVAIDTSGSGLHKRGYRKLSSAAPLRETLAAGMVLLSGWTHDRALIDPFCGSGTIPIEAAMIGTNRAPGLMREFAAEKWPNLPARIWAEAREEARAMFRDDKDLRIFGFDIDGEVLSLARYHSRQAGVERHIHFQQRPVSELRSRFEYGYVVCNPPYGERLGEIRQAEQAYREMGHAFRELDTWSWFVLSPHPRFERLFGLRAQKRRKLYNGRIECQLYQYFGPNPPTQGGSR